MHFLRNGIFYGGTYPGYRRRKRLKIVIFFKKGFFAKVNFELIYEILIIYVKTVFFPHKTAKNEDKSRQWVNNL